jgi:hypothetical protein
MERLAPDGRLSIPRISVASSAAPPAGPGPADRQRRPRTRPRHRSCDHCNRPGTNAGREPRGHVSRCVASARSKPSRFGIAYTGCPTARPTVEWVVWSSLASHRALTHGPKMAVTTRSNAEPTMSRLGRLTCDFARESAFGDSCRHPNLDLVIGRFAVRVRASALMFVLLRLMVDSYFG